MTITNEYLSEVFQKLRSLMKKYERDFTAALDFDSKYELWSFKDIVLDDRKTDAMFFAGLAIRKDYVGLYIMPLYVDPDIIGLLKPELLKLLKGKSCFHIKRLDDTLEKQIEEVLEIGYKLYDERRWV